MNTQNLVTETCYLCGEQLCAPTSADHVPPKQFYPKSLRKKNNIDKLLTISVHDKCNKDYQYDEDYFVNTLAPLARGSYTGNALLKKIVNDYHAGTKKGLVQNILQEFETKPSGIILPKNKVVKRFQGERVNRIVLKILRGLYFHHFKKCLPENLLSKITIHTEDNPPSEIFYLAIANRKELGVYPGVFDYKFADFPKDHNLHYWGFLFWDKIIITILFQYPEHNCLECKNI